MSLIKFINVNKIYDDNFVAAENLNFEIDRGEFVFLIGPSGAGKSTIIKMLIREELPTSGEILIDNENITLIEPSKLHRLRRRIGVIFQDYKVLNSKTVFENVSVSLEVVKSSKKTIKEIVPNVLNLVGLQEKHNIYPYKLSGGEKQRLAIARALAHEPDILVADEPTGMIDPKATTEVMDVLKKVHSLGTTVLMATHDEQIVNNERFRVIALNKGKIVSDKKEGDYESIKNLIS